MLSHTALQGDQPCATGPRKPRSELAHVRSPHSAQPQFPGANKNLPLQAPPQTCIIPGQEYKWRPVYHKSKYLTTKNQT